LKDEIFISGSEQEQYWRIPARLSAASLKTKAAFLEKALEGNFEVGDLNVNYLGGRPTLSTKSALKKSKKKKEKRGPNKWMPMKRAVDEEALARYQFFSLVIGFNNLVLTVNDKVNKLNCSWFGFWLFGKT